MKRLINGAALILACATLATFLLFPLYYAMITSLKSGAELFRVTYWPTEFDFTNYLRIWKEQQFARNILNSVIVATSVVALSLALALTAAYALGRVQFAGRRMLLYSILAISMFPQIAVLSGLFEVIRVLGLYNSLAGLIFSYMIFTLPFTVWVLTTFMRDLPVEIEEAAILDGLSPFVIVTQIFMPLMAPAMAATGLLAFIAAWNEFLFALTFTLSNEQRTVPVAIALITGASEYELPWGNIMAASVIVTLPLIALVLIFQRHLVAGLTAGAVKG